MSRQSDFLVIALKVFANTVQISFHAAHLRLLQKKNMEWQDALPYIIRVRLEKDSAKLVHFKYYKSLKDKVERK